MPAHYDFRDDLGIGLMRRGQERRQRAERWRAEDYEALQHENPYVGLYGPIRSILGTPSSGPLPDPQWEGFFQALEEAGVENLADASVGARRGMFSPSRETPSVRQRRVRRERETGTGESFLPHEAWMRSRGF